MPAKGKRERLRIRNGRIRPDWGADFADGACTTGRSPTYTVFAGGVRCENAAVTALFAGGGFAGGSIAVRKMQAEKAAGGISG